MAFDRLGWQKIYRSVSPFLELQLRPWGWKGPFFTMDYDRAIKNILRSNMEYERWEANAEYIHHLDRLQSLQMRLGFGFYTKGSNTNYFLDYENFRENNLPGGWNDDWSGEFELLNGDDYNYSNYYIRANLTYESPLLLFSRIPWAGHYIELERIYISALDVKISILMSRQVMDLPPVFSPSACLPLSVRASLTASVVNGDLNCSGSGDDYRRWPYRQRFGVCGWPLTFLCGEEHEIGGNGTEGRPVMLRKRICL